MIRAILPLFACVALTAAATHSAVTVSTAKVSVSVLLPHCDVSALEEELMAVSTPGSPRRFDYKPRSELYQMLYPCQDRIDALQQWLSTENIDPKRTFWSEGKDFVSFSTTAAHVRKSFGVRVNALPHPSNPNLAMAHANFVIDDEHALSNIVLPKIRVRGAIDASEMMLQSSDDEKVTEKQIVEFNIENAKAAIGGSDLALAYPLKFYPPLPVFEVAIREGQQSEVITISTCIDHPWPNTTVPLPEGVYPFSPTDPNDPCGTGNTVGDYTITLEPTSGTGSNINVTPSKQCAAVEFVLQQYGESLCLVSQETAFLQICILTFEAKLEPLVPYNLNLLLTMSDFTKYHLTYSASNGRPLAVVQAPTLYPAEFRSRYSVPADAAVCDDTLQQAIAVPQQESSGFYSIDDLKSFYKTAKIDTKNAAQLQFVSTPDVSAEATQFFASQNMEQKETTIQNDPMNPGGETSLDVQYITALGLGALTTVWHGGFWAYSDPTVLQACWGFDALIEVVLLAQLAKSPPSVISFSYGWPEIDASEEEAFLNEHFMLMGAHGMSVIVASGDQGSRDYDFTYHDDLCNRLTPVFPGSSPYVTTVGGTQRTTTDGEEIACSIATGGLITTGGGFSIHHSALSFQKDAIATYVKTADLPPAHMFNSSNRGYPDVALFSHAYGVVDGGKDVIVDGTSASTPSFAGLVTLLNDALGRTTGKTLGFLNPSLYAAAKTHPDAFVDIVKGDNKCVGQGAPLQCCDTGYVTAAGWDPVTGLGSVNFPKLAAALLPAHSARTGNTTCAGLNNPGGSGGGLKTWEIAVIAVGGLALIGGVIAIFVTRGKKKSEADTDAYAPMLG